MLELREKNLISEFGKKRPLYEDFCLAVQKLLLTLLKKKKYKYQIYHRVKSLYSLKEKVNRKKNCGKTYKNLSDIKDLAGVRIIFYLESEKKKFIKDLEEMPHLTDIEELEKNNGYRAQHALIALDDGKFRGLKCEIQLVSIFNHAWAELEHDWLYKDRYNLKIKNPEMYEILKSQMEIIFKSYVRKLNSKLEKVAKQVPKF